jgi:hypothetical protein
MSRDGSPSATCTSQHYERPSNGTSPSRTQAFGKLPNRQRLNAAVAPDLLE